MKHFLMTPQHNYFAIKALPYYSNKKIDQALGYQMVSYQRLSKHTGVEVHGVDLSVPLTKSIIDEIYSLFVNHCLVLIRDQSITQEELVLASNQFGECAAYDRPKELRSDVQNSVPPEVMLITNIRSDGKPIGALPDGEMWFHHDMIHNSLPHKATLLYSVEIPSWGGNTLFANMFAAYDELPNRLKKELEGKQALNIFNYGSRMKNDPDGLNRQSQAIHPTIYQHEETGRKAIYVDRLMTHKLIGIPEYESDAILNEVFDHIENPDYSYEHVWKKGDVLMWDNRSSIHARKDFPPDEIRLMWRTTLKGIASPA
jgi:taurine dioxygenase